MSRAPLHEVQIYTINGELLYESCVQNRRVIMLVPLRIYASLSLDGRNSRFDNDSESALHTVDDYRARYAASRAYFREIFIFLRVD